MFICESIPKAYHNIHNAIHTTGIPGKDVSLSELVRHHAFNTIMPSEGVTQRQIPQWGSIIIDMSMDYSLWLSWGKKQNVHHDKFIQRIVIRQTKQNERSKDVSILLAAKVCHL